jgi:hypothetical protein
MKSGKASSTLEVMGHFCPCQSDTRVTLRETHVKQYNSIRYHFFYYRYIKYIQKIIHSHSIPGNLSVKYTEKYLQHEEVLPHSSIFGSRHHSPQYIQYSPIHHIHIHAGTKITIMS